MEFKNTWTRIAADDFIQFYVIKRKDDDVYLNKYGDELAVGRNKIEDFKFNSEEEAKNCLYNTQKQYDKGYYGENWKITNYIIKKIDNKQENEIFENNINKWKNK